MTRKTTPIIWLLVLFVLCLGPGPVQAGTRGLAKLVSPEGELEFDDQGRTRVIVLLKGYREFKGFQSLVRGAGSALRKKRVARFQDLVLGRIAPQEAGLLSRPANFPFLSLKVTAQGLARLQADEAVETIQADRRLELNTRQGLGLIRAEQARSLYGGAGVSVALIDSGVDYTHPALGGTVQGFGTFPNAKVIGGFDIGENDPDPMDNSGHGTTVSALAGGLERSRCARIRTSTGTVWTRPQRRLPGVASRRRWPGWMRR